MISEIDDQNVTIRSDTNTRGSIHLIQAGALRAELTLEHAIGAKYLYTIVATIGNDYISLVINGTSLGT